MENQREMVEQLYKDAFHPEDYVSTYYKSLDHEVEFFLTNLHHFFSSQLAGNHYIFLVVENFPSSSTSLHLTQSKLCSQNIFS